MLHVLTGAGFSTNVGTPLSSQVSDQAFTILHANGNSDAANRIRESGNFELACLGLQRGHPQLRAIKEAIVRIFRDIDEQQKLLLPNNGRPHLQGVVSHMMRLLTLVEPGGTVFTTNYDLLVERYLAYSDVTNFRLIRPHYIDDGSWFVRGSTSISRLEVPCKVVLDQQTTSARAYIKLHGSLDWCDSGQTPVIGVIKKEDIDDNSVLSRYWDLFRKKVTEPGARLLVIGYGFQDEHINSVLVEGATQGDLKLYIWDTLPMPTMLPRLAAVEPKLAESVVGYCSQSIRDRFPVTLSKYWLSYCSDLESFAKAE